MSQPRPARAAERFHLGAPAFAAAVARIVGGAASLLVLLWVVLVLFGIRPSAALPAMWAGAFGAGSYGHLVALSETLIEATPLLLTSLSVIVAWRCGLFSIGGEGQLLVGALAAMCISSLYGRLPDGLLTICMLAGGIAAGGVWSWIAGWLRVRKNVQEVISTVMLNYVALYLVGAMVQGPLQERSHSGPETDLLPNGIMLSRLLPISLTGGIQARLHSGVVLAAAAAAFVGILLYSTKTGFLIRLVGLNERAARAIGVNVDRIRLRAMWMSGALAGAAGAVQLLGVSQRLDANFSPGWGYSAIPVALLGGLNPAGAVAASLLFGALQAGGANAERLVGVPASVTQVVEAVAVLLVVVLRAVTAQTEGAEEA